MLRGSIRFGKLFASCAALALLTVPIAGCGDDGGPEEAFEEAGDEIEDAGEKVEDEIDDLG